MVHPEAAYHLGWPAWRDGGQVSVQERLFLREQLAGDFDPEYPEVDTGARQEMPMKADPSPMGGQHA